MGTDIIFMGIGVVFILGMPFFSQKIPFFQNQRFFFILTFFHVWFQIEVHGNHELLLGFVLGNCLFSLLVIGGVAKLSGNKSRGDKEGFRFVRRAWAFYFSFSVIMVLLLSADYLFTRKNEQDQISRLDGAFLLCLLLLFFHMELPKEFWHNLYHTVKTEKQKSKKVLSFLFWMAFTAIGSYCLVDGLIGCCMKGNLRFDLAGLLFLSWCVQSINIQSSLKAETAETLVDSAVFDSIWMYLFPFGFSAILLPLPITYEIILHFLIMSVISILLVWRDQFEERLTGSLMLTGYVASVVIMVWK